MSEIRIPQLLAPYFDDAAREQHQSFAAMSHSEVVDATPALRTVSFDEGEIGYIDIPPTDEADTAAEAIVFALPYASGWTPNRFLRVSMVGALAATGRRIVALPGNSPRQEAISLDKQNRARIAQGDMRPIGELDARLLKSLGISRAAIMGYSFGAMRAAELASVVSDVVDVTHVGTFDAPNAVDRTPSELQRDFSNPGMRPFVDAVRAAEVPALSADFGITNETKGVSLRILRDLARFGLASLDPENAAIRTGMARDTLPAQLDTILARTQPQRLVVANAQHSLILPTERVDALRTQFTSADNAKFVTVDGPYGHEMGDNILVQALLAKLVTAA